MSGIIGMTGTSILAGMRMKASPATRRKVSSALLRHDPQLGTNRTLATISWRSKVTYNHPTSLTLSISGGKVVLRYEVDAELGRLAPMDASPYLDAWETVLQISRAKRVRSGEIPYIITKVFNRPWVQITGTVGDSVEVTKKADLQRELSYLSGHLKGWLRLKQELFSVQDKDGLRMIQEGGRDTIALISAIVDTYLPRR